mmetsp:Transcript_2981/g.2698  ORF Transcript_2981/g.2698 Transcript_2981/m.2698 type:complete len:239 (-) Transcript_2981:737-1453(-)
MAGEFSFMPRLRTAIYRHFRILFLEAIAGLICLIYLLVENELTIDSLPIFLIVLSNCWGLFLVIVFLGYGLVAIPKSFWYAGKSSDYLKYLYVKATILDEGIIEVKYKLDDIIRLVNTASYKIQENSSLQRPLDILLSICPLEMLEHHRTMQTHESRDSTEQLGTLNEKRLIELHKELKKTISEYKRSNCRWSQLVDETLLLEDIIASHNNQEKIIKSSVILEKSGLFSIKGRKSEWL